MQPPDFRTPPGDADTLDSDENFDPSRRLCPDGACVGVLGGDDRCSVCGTRGGDDAPGLSPAAFGGGCQDDEAPRDVALATEAFDPGARRLCPDGACVGLIGPAGRCLECGRAESV